MSIVVSGSNTGLSTGANLSNPQSFTKLIWVKHASAPTTFETIVGSINAGFTAEAELAAGANSGNLNVSTAPGGFNDFASQPTWANWNCFVITGTTAGANSLKGYWRDNGGSSFTSQSTTGLSFTNAIDSIGYYYAPVAMTMAYYMEWSVVLTPTEMATQFLSATPVVQLANLRRYMPLSTAATAATDSSGNNFGMSTLGTLTNGASLPTFPASAALVSAAYGETSITAQLTPSLLSFMGATASLYPFGIFESRESGLSSFAGKLTSFASVTLTAPLYMGLAGVLDGYLWSFAFPQVGSVVYYDPTFITIAPNGEISSTSNNCTAAIQFQIVGGQWVSAVLTLTPTLTSYWQAESILTGTLSGAAQAMSGFGAALASLPANLLTAIPLGTTPNAVSTMTAMLNTAFGLANYAIALAAMTATMTASIRAQTNATALATASATLKTTIRQVAAGYGLASVVGALTTASRFKTNAAALASMTAGLQNTAFFVSAANAVATMATKLTNGVRLQASAGGVASIAASVTVPKTLTASASGVRTVNAALAIGSGFKAQALGESSLTASLFYGINLASLFSGEALFDPPFIVTLQQLTTPVLIANQIPGLYSPGSEPLGQFNIPVGTKSFFAIDWTYWISIRWQPGYVAAPGYVVRPYPWTGFEYICTQAGQTGAYPPVWPNELGQLVLDGSVLWQAQPLSSASLQTSVVSAVYSAPPGITAIAFMPVGNLTPVQIDATLATPGQSYSVACTCTMADGDFLIGQFVLNVNNASTFP